MRPLLAGLLLAALVLAACSDGSATGDTTAGGGNASPTPEEATEGALADGLAARVNGTEIPSEEVDARVEAATASEEVAAQLEGSGGEQMLAEFRAQTLSVLVQTRIVLDGAEELGAAPTTEDVEAARADLVEQVGGEEAFEEAVGQAGMSTEALDEQLRGIAAIDAVGAALVEQGATEDLPDSAQGDPQQVAVQQWLGEQIAAADVVVDPAYGQWDPTTGQVLPPAVATPAPGATTAPTSEPGS